MNRNAHLRLAVAFFLLALALPMAAQDPQTPPADDTSAEPAKPSLLTILRTPFPGQWTVSGELNFSQEYNDNVFPASTTRLFDYTSRFSGTLSLEAAKKHLTFQAHYVPQYSHSEHIDGRDTFSQQAYVSSEYKFTGRTAFNGSFGLNESKFNAVQPFQFTVVDQLVVPVFNPEVAQRDSDTFSLNGQLGMTHHFSARNSMTATMGGYLVRITQRDATGDIVVSRQQNYSATASLGWEHQVNARRTFGVEVSEAYLAYPDNQSHANSQTISLTFSQELPRGFSFHASAGPDFRTRSGGTSGSQGLEVTSAYSFGVSKSIETGAVGISILKGSRLGATADTVSTTTATLFVTKELFRRWQFTSSFGYGRSNGLAGGDAIESYSTQARIGYHITRKLTAMLAYSYMNQIGARATIGNQNYDRNLFTFGLSYDLGRLFSE